jgi:hypothetical protein
MTPINTDELVQQMRAAAEAATPGPWRRLTSFRVISSGDKPVAGADCRGRSISSARNDADHIALANPANVLALIAALEQETARADAAEAKVALASMAMEQLFKAQVASEDTAGTLPAREAVKLVPRHWHRVMDGVRAVRAALASTGDQ